MKINDNIEVLDVNDIYATTLGIRTDESIAWYKSARSNLRSAKALLDNKQYPHSVFFLQQSIECVVKAIVLENKVIDNAKIFSHSPEKALELFYKKMNSGSIEFCVKIKDRMKDLNDFESRIVEMAAQVNSQAKEYMEIERMKDINGFLVNKEAVVAIGLPGSAISDEVAYKFIFRKQFVLNLVYCFSILFSTTQQSSRYPTCVNGNLLIPTQQYSLPKIIEGLTTILPWFDFILQEVYE